MNELIIKEPDTSTIQKIIQKIQPVCQDSLLLTVDSKVSQALASASIITIRDTQKLVEIEKKSWTDPLNKIIKRLREQAKPVEDMLDKAEKHLAIQLNSWYLKEKELERKEQERQNKLAQKRFDRAEEKGINIFPTPIAPIVQLAEKKVETDNGGITYITQKKAIVKDITKVPLFVNNIQLLTPDLNAIKKLLEAGVEVSGCELIEESYIRTTR